MGVFDLQGFACGFFETDAGSFDEACARIEKLDINAKWQKAMAKYTPDAGDPLVTPISSLCDRDGAMHVSLLVCSDVCGY